MQGNLEWFRTFRAVYDTGTMSGAAKDLYISQPGVGLHLNALEAYTGFPLFERTPRKMIPTEKGKLLYQQLLHALTTLEDIETRFRRKSGDVAATVSVGMCVETFQHVLEQHIPELGFNLMMQFGSSPQLIQLLENGSVALVLPTTASNASNLVFHSFAKERLVLIAGKGTDVSGFRSARQKKDKNKLAEWMRSQLWYSTAADMEALTQFWQSNFDELPGFVPNYIVPNKFSITRCLSIGKGLAVIPDFLCRDAIEKGDITKLWEGYRPAENTLYFGRRKQPLYENEIKQVEKLLVSAFKDK